MMQQAVVAVVVALAAFAVAWRYAPAAWKAVGTALAMRGARRLGWDALAARLEALPEKPSCGSGDCSSCSGCDLVPRPSAKGEFAVFIQPRRQH